MTGFFTLALIAFLTSPESAHRHATELLSQGQFHRAAQLARAAVQQYELRFGKSSLETALLLRDLAKAYRGERALMKAESVERREIEILRTRLGEDDANMALAQDVLAEILIDQGRFTEAARLLRLAESKLDPQNPHLAAILNDLGVICYHDRQFKEAALLFHRALEIHETSVTRSNLATIEQSITLRHGSPAH
ncbi:MAG TPA: tetratricopeptide repeat protein [Bryobacteraceae bacterium]|nr:tetratricopeptide repeat protein [Bryobacteraceae bacterium]